MTALGLASPLELLDELKRKVRALQRLVFQVLEIVGALGRRHDLVHQSEWQVQIVGGVAVFRPPAFVDPQRRPQHNLLHVA